MRQEVAAFLRSPLQKLALLIEIQVDKVSSSGFVIGFLAAVEAPVVIHVSEVLIPDLGPKVLLAWHAWDTKCNNLIDCHFRGNGAPRRESKEVSDLYAANMHVLDIMPPVQAGKHPNVDTLGRTSPAAEPCVAEAAPATHFTQELRVRKLQLGGRT